MKFITIIVFCVLCLAGLEAEVVGQALDCPVITVYGPNSLTPKGKPMIFSAKVSGDTAKYSLSYEWTVTTNGKIISGQGTSQISVVSQIEGESVTATIEIKGLPTKCENTASDVSAIASEANRG